MKMKRENGLAKTGIKISVLIFLDQISKYAIRFQGGFYVCNSGIAFGIGKFNLLFWIFWSGIIFFLGRLYFKKNENCFLPKISLIFIFSGAFSNAIDRFFQGCVVDFIDFRIWPVFNLADIFIVFGLGMAIYFYGKAELKKKSI